MSDWLDFAIEHLPYVIQGIPTTLALWVSAMAMGAVLALVLAWARIYGNRPVYMVATVYVEIFRGTPMLVQMLFIYLGLPEIGIVLDPMPAAILAIGLNTAAYQAEYIRGAVRSVPGGQMAAARALGMGRFQGS